MKTAYYIFIPLLLLTASFGFSQSYFVDGYVIVEDLFVPVEGQIIEIESEDGGTIAFTLTDETGYFEHEFTASEGDDFITLKISRDCGGQVFTYDVILELDNPHLSYIFNVCKDIPCEAKFNYEGQSLDGLDVMFTDVSLIDVNEWFWDFGDGYTSDEMNPVHTFENPGEYQVSLTVTTDSCSAEAERSVFVNYQSCLAKFSFEQVNQGEQLFVNFENNSLGNYVARLWSFIDEDTIYTSEQNPKHLYEEPGEYNVLLSIGSLTCVSNLNKIVHVIPKQECFALFTNEQIISPQLQVEFEDISAGESIFYWYWEFGDGSNSELQNPVHIYQETGTYEVALRVISTIGQSYYTREIEVFESTGCIADFTWMQPDPDNPQVVFNSLTPNGDLVFSWDFGDGDGSGLKSPAHQFEDFGTYEVALSVLGYGCNGSFSQTIVLEEPVYCDAKFTWQQDFPQSRTIDFVNQSFESEIEYLWDFGDGQTSMAEHPSHTYETFGEYLVKLVVNTWDGCVDSTSTTIQILPPFNLSGYVYAGDSPISFGKAYLYQVDSSGGIFLYGISNLDGGFYEFLELTPGDYFVQAIPEYEFPFPVIPFYNPVYAGGGFQWQDADIVQTSAIPQDVNLNLESYDDFFTGKATIGGSIQQSGEADDLPLLIYFTDGEDEIFRFEFIDQTMQFSFDQIPFGSYALMPEKAGKTSEPFYLLVDEDNPDVHNILFLETDQTIKPDLSNINVPSIGNLLSIRPNPAYDYFKVTFSQIQTGEMELRIFDAKTGALKLSQIVDSGSRISLKNLSSGIYIVEANTIYGTFVKKLLVSPRTGY